MWTRKKQETYGRCLRACSCWVKRLWSRDIGLIVYCVRKVWLQESTLHKLAGPGFQWGPQSLIQIHTVLSIWSPHRNYQGCSSAIDLFLMWGVYIYHPNIKSPSQRVFCMHLGNGRVTVLEYVLAQPPSSISALCMCVCASVSGKSIPSWIDGNWAVSRHTCIVW